MISKTPCGVAADDGVGVVLIHCRSAGNAKNSIDVKPLSELEFAKKKIEDLNEFNNNKQSIIDDAKKNVKNDVKVDKLQEEVEKERKELEKWYKPKGKFEKNTKNNTIVTRSEQNVEECYQLDRTDKNDIVNRLFEKIQKNT